MRFRLIEDHRDVWPVRVMCDALSVSPSGFYAWRSQPESPRKIANRELLVDIRRVHAQHRGRYGAPRIHAELRAEGQTVCRKRVERVMRQHGIRAHAPRRYRVCTTDSKHSLPVAANLLDRNFIADRPNQVWLADITLYLIRVAGHSRSTRRGQPEYHLRRLVCDVDGAPGLTHAPWTRSDGSQSPLRGELE